jgi:hypothetical protein
MVRTPAKNKGGENEPYLKGKNTAYLWAFTGINIAIFLCLLVGHALSEKSLDHFWQKVTMKNGFLAAAIPILAIILAGVLGDTAKARLVFWRWANPLPGCRAFSTLLKRDPRIDSAGLQSKIGAFPVDAHEQSALWFTLYRRHRAATRVLEAQRIYLLTRDMSAIAAAFVVLLPLIVLLGSSESKVVGFYTIGLLVQYVLAACAARNYGNRFVLNVLSEELHGS